MAHWNATQWIDALKDLKASFQKVSDNYIVAAVVNYEVTDSDRSQVNVHLNNGIKIRCDRAFWHKGQPCGVEDLGNYSMAVKPVTLRAKLADTPNEDGSRNLIRLYSFST